MDNVEYYWANINCCKLPNIEKINLAIWSHCGFHSLSTLPNYERVCKNLIGLLIKLNNASNIKYTSIAFIVCVRVLWLINHRTDVLPNLLQLQKYSMLSRILGIDQDRSKSLKKWKFFDENFPKIWVLLC